MQFKFLIILLHHVDTSNHLILTFSIRYVHSLILTPKVVEDEANIVRLIFSLYTEGYGYKAIANRLNHAGYKTKKDTDFSITSVRSIVCNPTYAGFIRFNSVQNWSDKRRRGKSRPIIVKGVHEPIIDEATWQKAQGLLTKKSGKSAKTFSGHFLFESDDTAPQQKVSIKLLALVPN
ncbi:recombinase family protein [Alicyclobacillus acidoterrestris]|uniref:recombinase family protein n=1 Tax=Alicyclobacillus acidoterrestris TaxID=1450 RepID=UPI003F5335BA